MNYNVINKDNNIYNIEVIKLSNGKFCFYWKNKGNTPITEIIIILNNVNQINIKNNQICLSLDKVTDINDITNMLNAFFRESQKKGINIGGVKFTFIVDTLEEERKIGNIVSNSNLNVEIKNKQTQTTLTTPKMEQVEQKQKEVKELTAEGNARNITKQEVGKEKNYYTVDGKVYENNQTLKIEQEKQLLLAEWMKDPVMFEEIANLTTEELDERLTKAVTVNRKTYYMENASSTKEINPNNKGEKMARDKAKEEDGLYNAELGIIQNGVENATSKYSAVEESMDGQVHLVNPTVSSSTLSSNGQTESTTSTYNASIHNDDSIDVTLTKENENEREELKTYYLDEESLIIYNEEGKAIGRLGLGGYTIDYNTNELLENGKPIGKIGDIRDMGKSNSNTKEKGYTRVYKKQTNYSQRRNPNQAAFISFPVIIFIISLLLLISSGIILLLMK